MEDEERTTVTETTTNSVAPGSATRQTTSSVVGTPSGSVMAQRFVYVALGVIEALLAIRFVLSLLGANLGNPFAAFVYNVSGPLVAPFQTLFNYQTSYGASHLELETIIAIAVYTLLAYLAVALLRIPSRSSSV